MATDKEPEFSHYEQSERKYTEAELQELFDQLRKGSLMFFSLPPQNGKTAMREQLSMKWNVPPKDMVEVVRCKNCVYRPYLPKECNPDESDGLDLVFPCEGKCPCECEDGWYSYIPEDDWFCANGKRKGER